MELVDLVFRILLAVELVDLVFRVLLAGVWELVTGLTGAFRNFVIGEKIVAGTFLADIDLLCRSGPIAFGVVQ